MPRKQRTRDRAQALADEGNLLVRRIRKNVTEAWHFLIVTDEVMNDNMHDVSSSQ